MHNHILIVDDEIGIRELLSEILQDEGYAISVAANAQEARQFRLTQRPDLVLLDIWMPGCDGVTLLKEWANNGLLTMPVVMMSGHATIDTAVEATRMGAYDFMEKPISLQKLLQMVAQAIKTKSTPKPVDNIQLNLNRTPILQSLKPTLAQITNTKEHILFVGPEGSGFEYYARYLHTPKTPWMRVDVNTPLNETPKALLQQIKNGIIYIEDIRQLDGKMQRGIHYILDNADLYNVRLVVACPVPLGEFCQRYTFDTTLFKKLCQVTIGIPSLAEAHGETLELAKLSLIQICEQMHIPIKRLTTAALNALKSYEWPSNLEQLRNILHTLALTHTDDEIDAHDVLNVLKQYANPAPEAIEGLDMNTPFKEARENYERAYFCYHIKQENHNMSRVAERAGLERTHLYRKLKQLGIKISRKGDEGY